MPLTKSNSLMRQQYRLHRIHVRLHIIYETLEYGQLNATFFNRGPKAAFTVTFSAPLHTDIYLYLWNMLIRDPTTYLLHICHHSYVILSFNFHGQY